MKRAWSIAGAAFAMIFAVWAQQSWQLSLSDTLGPGPGFFPFCLSIAGILLAVAIIVQSQRSLPTVADADWRLFPRGIALMRLVLMLLALAVATALLDVVGYRATLAVFCLFLLRVLGARNWWIIGVFALAASFGVSALFSDLLKVPLPAGLFGL